MTFNRDNSDCERINAVTNANLEEGLLTVKDLARILNCGPTKAWELVSTHQVRTIRVGRLVRISPADLAEFMRDNRS